MDEWVFWILTCGFSLYFVVLLLEFNDRLLERYTIGGRLTRDQLVDGAEALWLGTLYGHVSEQRKATS